MKKIYAVLLASAVITAGLSTAAYASPLKSYEPGKVAIDAGITLPSSIEGDNYKMSKSDSTYLGATVGLGSNTALNYRWDNFKADEGKTRTQQLNLMYKLLPNLSAYAGYLNADTSTDHMGGHNNNSGQIGLQAQFELPLLFTVWGNVGYGDKNKSYEIGVSKPILNNVELNFSYYDHKFQEALGDDGDMKARGVNMGVTVKF